MSHYYNFFCLKLPVIEVKCLCLCHVLLPQVYSLDHEEETGASLEFVIPRDVADGFVNNKRECYKFRYIHSNKFLLASFSKLSSVLF